MKKIISLGLIAVAAMASVQASAQVRAVKGNSTEVANSISYSLPRTVVKVTVTSEKESIRKGPYARFAQKYLGVIAPLSDKDIYTITGANFAYATEADPSEVYVLENPDKNPMTMYAPSVQGFMALNVDGLAQKPNFSQVETINNNFGDMGISPLQMERVTVSYIESDTSFVKVPVDRKDIIEKSPEDMAADAANVIFKLRTSRMELITGAAGENVFGSGLEAALKEINRLEQEYLSLFLGKQFVQKIVRTYEVTPEAGKTNLIVCRFSDAAGLQPASDLSARPIVMELTPEKKAQSNAITRRGKDSKDARGTVFYRIADVVNCRLVDGKQQIAQQRIPIYQMGAVVEIPISSIK